MTKEIFCYEDMGEYERELFDQEIRDWADQCGVSEAPDEEAMEKMMREMETPSP